jgi:hypothetical protein
MVDEVFTGFEITAMWNLNGNDIKSAKQQLESRRAKLKADYEAELQKIDAELADIDTVERVAVNFVSSHKNGDAAIIEAEPGKSRRKGSVVIGSGSRPEEFDGPGKAGRHQRRVS